MATRQEQLSASRRRATNASSDLGALPAIADESSRDEAERDLAAWGVRYFGPSPEDFALLKHEPSARICEYAKILQSIIEGTGAVHVRLPRGSGKTTWCEIAILWAILTGRVRYGVIIGASALQAQSILANVWYALSSSSRLAADYPEACHAIQEANGISQRYAAQHYADGQMPQVRKTADTFSLPTLEGSRCSGATVTARGAGAALRGMVRGASRPDFVLLDDIQTRDDALSTIARDKLESWIQGDVRGLAGGDTGLRICMTSTPISHGDLSETFADADLHGEWRQVQFPLVSSWPETDEWARFDEIYKATIRVDQSLAELKAYYNSHRATLEEGVQILDPLAYNRDAEPSAIFATRVKRLAMGEPAFLAEYQLQVKAASAVVDVTAKDIAAKVNGTPRGVLPPNIIHPVAFLDVNLIAGITWAVVAFGPHQRAAVIDYGRFVGGPRKRRLVPERTPARQARSIVAAAIANVVNGIRCMRFQESGGGPARRVSCIWVDEGFETDTVRSVCNRLANGGECLPCRGFSNERFLVAARSVQFRGDGVESRKSSDGRLFMAANADRSKEAVQSAFLAEPLVEGSLSLFGEDPRAHLLFADEVAAERLAEKATSARGVDIYRWSMRPNADNHFLDALSGCFSIARWHHLLADDTAATAIRSASPAPTPTANTAPRIVARKPRRAFSPPRWGG